MSIFGKDRLFHGLFSTAGIISAEKYKIYEEIKKTKEREKGQFFHDSFLPDKEWKESLEKKEIIKPSDIIRGCKFNIDELKTEIKQQNLYFKDDFPKIKKIKNIKKYINLRNNKSNPKKKNPLHLAPTSTVLNEQSLCTNEKICEILDEFYGKLT